MDTAAPANCLQKTAVGHELAERRGFLLVYVPAFPDNGISGGHTVPLPSWNALNIHAQTDDVKYIDYVLSSVKNSYPVDSERVYVSGHSNGSLLTQRLMEERPLAFAAFGPQGAPYHMGLDGTAVDRTIHKDGHHPSGMADDGCRGYR